MSPNAEANSATHGASEEPLAVREALHPPPLAGMTPGPSQAIGLPSPSTSQSSNKPPVGVSSHEESKLPGG